MAGRVSIERWSTLLRPKTLSVYPVSMVQMGPRTFFGRRQLGAPDAGYWGLKASFQILTRDQLLEWRGQIAAMQGGLNSIIMGVFDDRQAPTPVEGGPVVISGVTHSDGSGFSDGSGYSQSTINLELDRPMDEGDVTATFGITTAGPLRRGMYFSIDDRLSLITKPPEQTSSKVTVTFWPPSRIAAPAGKWVEMGRPTGTFQLADPRSGAADLSSIYFADPTLELEESFDGL